MPDGTDPEPVDSGSADIDDVPVISCTRCDRDWALEYELEELNAGNRAVEQFALDHQRHTGHFPDEVTPWIVECQQCPAGDHYLTERPARRWARTHARHTTHDLMLQPPNPEGPSETIREP